ncbi:hypothetical protein ACU686_39835 [Yinghuangia aomiensis]
MQPRNMSMRGVVDLGAVKAASDAAAQQRQALQATPAPQGGGVAGSGSGRLSFDLIEENFDSVLALSQQAPGGAGVLSQRSPHSIELGAVFDLLAAEYAGRFVLARLDIDATPQLAQELVMQAGVQGLPAAVAVVGGQLAPMFDRAAPTEEQLRGILDQLIAVGEQRFGLTGLARRPGRCSGRRRSRTRTPSRQATRRSPRPKRRWTRATSRVPRRRTEMCWRNTPRTRGEAGARAGRAAPAHAGRRRCPRPGRRPPTPRRTWTRRRSSRTSTSPAGTWRTPSAA